MSNNELETALGQRPEKKNPVKYIIFIILSLLIIAGAYWVTRQFLISGEVEIPLPKEIAAAVSEALQLEDGKLGPVRIAPGGPEGAKAPEAREPRRTEPPKDFIDDGRPSAGGILVKPGERATDIVEPQPAGALRQKVYSGSDAVVTPVFVNDLADYLADNYWPQGTHISAQKGPASSAGIGAAGQHYGIELTGFTSVRDEDRRDYLRDRALVLNYAYMPAMVEALTHLYADRFADSLAEAGFRQVRGGKPMSQNDVAVMLRFYADYSRSLGAALGAYNGREDAPQIVRQYTAAREGTYLANMRFHEAKYRADNAREEQNARGQRDARQDMKRAEQEYRKAVLQEERAKEAVLAFMHRGLARKLDDQELIYIAAWAARRGGGARPANMAAAAAGDFMGQVLDEKASELE